MESRLLNIYDRASDWLKFAEIKNGSLVAFNAAVIAGLFSTWDRFAVLGQAQGWVLWIAIGALSTSACLALAAMIPRVAFIDRKLSDEDVASSTVFFAHIAHRYPSAEAYLDAISRAWEEEATTRWKPGEVDLAQQIIQLSRVANHKYGHFKLAAWITLFVIGGVVGACVIWLVHRCMLAYPRPIDPAIPSNEAAGNPRP